MSTWTKLIATGILAMVPGTFYGLDPAPVVDPSISEAPRPSSAGEVRESERSERTRRLLRELRMMAASMMTRWFWERPLELLGVAVFLGFLLSRARRVRRPEGALLLGEPVADGRTVEVYWATNPEDAHLVKGLLREADIDARVVGELLQVGAGGVPMGTSIAPCVWVSGREQVRARTIVAEWEERCRADRSKGRTSWECAQCGEAVEGSFDICWNCQAQRSTEPEVARQRKETTGEEPAGRWWPVTMSGSTVLVLFVLMGWFHGAILKGSFGGLFYAVYAYLFAVFFRAVYLRVSGRAGGR